MTPYRDSTAAVAALVAPLAARRRAEVAAAPRGWRSLYAHRVARIAFGATAVGALAGQLLVMAATDGGGIARALVVAWLAALVAYGLGLVLASWHVRRRLVAAVALSGEPHRDLAMLRATSPARIELAWARRHGCASHAWPLVAAVLLGPPTLHAAALSALGLRACDVDEVIRFATVASPHLYLYGLAVAWRFPQRRTARRDVSIVTLLAVVPGVLFWFLSLPIVFGTAMVLAVVAGGAMRRIIDREQARLAAAEAIGR